jgi:hypothetical protein
MKPAKLNLVIHQRATFRQSFDFGMDLSGYTVYAQVWDAARRTQYASFTVQWTAQASGQFDLVLPYATTSDLKKDAVWDLLLEQPDGERYYYLEGDVTIDLGYSAPA